MTETIEVLVEGGSASAGPPLGPALGPMGVNTGEVVKQINEKTGDFKGMKIPVEVIVDPATKSFEIKVGSPPTSALILKELGSERGGGSENAGDLTAEQVIKIGKNKYGSVLSNTPKASVKEVAGTCQSLKVTIEGMTPREFIKKIDEGAFDEQINQ
ncbi:MAG: 50S ribosomal protein L11 [Candidatus Altiarchaeales archaeon]|nr:50S ribosomal protein L11 [Candidatus Altiarchaeales archaeon]